MMKKSLLVVLALLPLGCSFSYSSDSSVKSSHSSSTSSSKSEDKKEAYRDDIRDFTAAYASTHQDLQGFEHGLGEVARRHGITDWEADDITYIAVGAGLKRAGVSDPALTSYETTLGGTEPAKVALIRSGYQS
jgi:hypothetical protein